MARTKRCPKCGGDEFTVTAHVAQTWKVDADGNFLETISECDQVTHRPDEDDLWTCARCGFDAAGSVFTQAYKEYTAKG